MGLDETIVPAWARASLPEGMPVQGNLDPLLLLAGGEALEATAHRSILAAFSGRPHVFNLGHGIDKETPIAHVERLWSFGRTADFPTLRPVKAGTRRLSCRPWT